MVNLRLMNFLDGNFEKRQTLMINLLIYLIPIEVRKITVEKSRSKIRKFCSKPFQNSAEPSP